jgi:hypothetical protein
MRNKFLHYQAVHITVLCVIIQWFQTGTGAQPASYSVVTRASFPQSKKVLDVKLTIYLHVMRSLGMSGANPPPIHMVCFLIKYIDDFIFFPLI